ncbi:MAG TPA: formate dehydrogenase [Anaerolineae bacterium]|nr:formate dehydrogenase [Anaerolineae bacterium]
MSIKAILSVRDGDMLGTLRRFLADLLERGFVDVLLVPLEGPGGAGIAPALVTDPAQLERANPIAPAMPINAAVLVSALTRGEPGARIGAVLRPCEIRALIELVKLKQAHLEPLIIIGVDCLGTYEVTDYVKLVQAGGHPTAELLAQASQGDLTPLDGARFRAACQMCEAPLPTHADISIGLLGVEVGREILVELPEGLAEELGLTPTEVDRRQEAVEELIAARIKRRDEVFAEVRERVKDIPGLLAQFATCIRCYNCTVACPLCYCKECLFRTPTFDHESDRYLRWAERKGAIRMPTDTLLFQLTRMNHMAVACVGCGLCESACPSDLPLTAIFRAVGSRVQALFDYLPGRSLEEELPLIAFREEELVELGGQ